MERHQARLVTPFAVLGITTQADALTGIEFLPRSTPPLAPWNSVAEEACRQLHAYLQDPHFAFRLPVRIEGTSHRKKVWAALSRIPPGQPLTYGELARRLGSAPRAVGQACAANPLPVLIPCHRVVGATGLGGFMGAGDGDPLAIKAWLLRHESG